MTKPEGIETAITRLPPDELAELREWFEEFAGQQWDAQIERDAKAGRLDCLPAVIQLAVVTQSRGNTERQS